MRSIAADVLTWRGLSVGHDRERCKMTEPIEMPFGGSAHWRHLMNTIERSVRSYDTALYQIILTTCL